MAGVESVNGTDITFRRRGGGETALIFVHGFLDDQHVWDDVVEHLADVPAEFIPVDLAGCGERYGAHTPFSYERFADDITQIAAAVGKPFVIVGQSMGAAVSELVVAGLPELAIGLVLLTPVPLAGTQLQDSEIEPFRSLGEKGAEAQRLVRRELSFALSEEKLDRLTAAGTVIRPEVIRSLADCWNCGHPDGRRESRYEGPVLALYGRNDPMVTEEMVASGVAPRFSNIRTAAVDDAGHWPHAEQPRTVAVHIRQFLSEHGRQRSTEVKPASENSSKVPRC